MLSFFKNFFTPTEENRGVPACLSGYAFVFYFLTGLIIGLSPFYSHRLQLASLSSLVSFPKNEILAFINNSRASAGLPQLQENDLLSIAAEKKADDMLAKQYFSHTSPDNKTPWFFIKNEGYRYSAAGENLAIDYVSAADTHSALMNSPSHRANILNPSYTQIGIAIEKGFFENHESILVVQFFGKPKIVENLTLKIKSGVLDVKNQNADMPAVKDSKPKAENPIPKTNSLPAAQPEYYKPTVPSVINGEVLGEKTNDMISLVLPAIKARVIAWIVLGLTLISFSFLVLRGGIITVGVLTRSFLIVLIFGYMFFFGVKNDFLVKIQPVAQSITESGI